jgi:hypothetical protein
MIAERNYMGCPPSPEEKEEQILRESIWDSKERILKLKNGIDAFLQILHKLEGLDHLSNDMRLALKKLGEDSLSSISMIGDPYGGIPSMNENTDYHEFLSHLYTVVHENEGKEKELETLLCNSRSKLINVMSGHEELFYNFSKEIENLKKDYTKHRIIDKEQWLVWLQEKLNFCLSIIQEKEEAESVQKNAGILVLKIKAEITRTKGLSEAEILADPSAFGRTSELFDPVKVLF